MKDTNRFARKFYTILTTKQSKFALLVWKISFIEVWQSYIATRVRQIRQWFESPFKNLEMIFWVHYHCSIQEVCVNWLPWLTRERFFQRDRLSAGWYTWYSEVWHKRDNKNRAKTALFHPILHGSTHTKNTYRGIGQLLASINTSRLFNWFASKSDCHGKLEKPILEGRLRSIKLPHKKI